MTRSTSAYGTGGSSGFAAAATTGSTGRLDPKDVYGWQANNSADRLTRPLLHGREVGWDEAMAAVVARSKELREGPQQARRCDQRAAALRPFAERYAEDATPAWSTSSTRPPAPPYSRPGCVPG